MNGYLRELQLRSQLQQFLDMEPINFLEVLGLDSHHSNSFSAILLQAFSVVRRV